MIDFISRRVTEALKMVDEDVLKKVNAIGPNPNSASIEAPIEEVTESNTLPFDPDDLRAKYRAERDKRLAVGGGLQQYRLTDGKLSDYLVDPWVEPGFNRNAVEESVDVVIVGGGYGALLAAVRLLERGITNIKIIEKAGDFGGTW